MRGARPARNRERGAIAILMFIMLMVLMGFTAVGFDLAYVRLARLEMKNATDAAVHAAILRLRNTGDSALATQAGIDIAAQNSVLGKPMTLAADDFTFGQWDGTTGAFVAGAVPYTAVKINGVRDVADSSGYVDLTFGRALGYTEASVTEDTVGAFANRNFMVELDITPSYICQLDDAVLATLSMLDDLHAKNIGGDKISLDVFTGEANEFTPFQNIRSNYATIYQTWAGGGTYSTFLNGKTSGITVCNKLDDPTGGNGGSITCGSTTYAYPNNPNIQSCSRTAPTGYATPLFAGTDLGAAINAGTAKLTAQTASYEPRILIVVTDGSPMTCTAPQGGDLCSNGANPCCADGFCNVANALASGKQYRIDACNAAHAVLNGGVTAANAAAAANIDLFVVKVTGSATDNASNYASSLVRNKGTFHWISDTTQLGSTFSDIVGQVPVSLVK
jgi:Flp pilus assembly protein TadG